MTAGMQAGMEAGMEAGMQAGEQKGIIEAKIETARKMKAKGLEIGLIAELTELSREEIEKL